MFILHMVPNLVGLFRDFRANSNSKITHILEVLQNLTWTQYKVSQAVFIESKSLPAFSFSFF